MDEPYDIFLFIVTRCYDKNIIPPFLGSDLNPYPEQVVIFIPFILQYFRIIFIAPFKSAFSNFPFCELNKPRFKSILRSMNFATLLNHHKTL